MCVAFFSVLHFVTFQGLVLNYTLGLSGLRSLLTIIVQLSLRSGKLCHFISSTRKEKHCSSCYFTFNILLYKKYFFATSFLMAYMQGTSIWQCLILPSLQNSVEKPRKREIFVKFPLRFMSWETPGWIHSVPAVEKQLSWWSLAINIWLLRLCHSVDHFYLELKSKALWR